MNKDQHQGTMGSRGVTRPMAEQQMQQGEHGDHGEDSHHGDGHEMTHDDRLAMLQMHHRHTLWIYWTLPLLGIWLLQLFQASIWGMSYPPTLIVATVAGVVLMFSPTWFGIDIRTHAADIAHLGGALTVTVAVIAMGEVLRIVRYLNVLLGLIVAAGPWLTDGMTFGYDATCSALGLLVAALAVPRGAKLETYGGWDRYVR
jgi:hypothetical protein